MEVYLFSSFPYFITPLFRFLILIFIFDVPFLLISHVFSWVPCWLFITGLGSFSSDQVCDQGKSGDWGRAEAEAAGVSELAPLVISECFLTSFALKIKCRHPRTLQFFCVSLSVYVSLTNRERKLERLQPYS